MPGNKDKKKPQVKASLTGFKELSKKLKSLPIVFLGHSVGHCNQQEVRAAIQAIIDNIDKCGKIVFLAVDSLQAHNLELVDDDINEPLKKDKPYTSVHAYQESLFDGNVFLRESNDGLEDLYQAAKKHGKELIVLRWDDLVSTGTTITKSDYNDSQDHLTAWIDLVNKRCRQNKLSDVMLNNLIGVVNSYVVKPVNDILPTLHPAITEEIEQITDLILDDKHIVITNQKIKNLQAQINLLSPSKEKKEELAKKIEEINLKIKELEGSCDDTEATLNKIETLQKQIKMHNDLLSPSKEKKRTIRQKH